MLPLPDCGLEIADYYQVPAEVIAAVQQVESGPRGQEVGRVGPNADGTYDLGAMQINTWWLQSSDGLARFGIDERELMTNECTNYAVGTWILHRNLHRYGDWEAALSAYNTGNPDSPEGRAYAERVLDTVERLQP